MRPLTPWWLASSGSPVITPIEYLTWKTKRDLGKISKINTIIWFFVLKTMLCSSSRYVLFPIETKGHWERHGNEMPNLEAIRTHTESLITKSMLFFHRVLHFWVVKGQRWCLKKIHNGIKKGIFHILLQNWTSIHFQFSFLFCYSNTSNYHNATFRG